MTAGLLAFGLLVLALGIVDFVGVPSTDSSATGTVVARGFRLDGSECYLTAAYTVDGTRFRVDSSRDKRWCDFRHDDSIPVHYDSADPGTATLTPRGGRQVGLVALGLLGVAGAVASAALRGCDTATDTRPQGLLRLVRSG